VGFALGHGGNKLKGFRLAARGGVLAGWKVELYIERERFALKCNAVTDSGGALQHSGYRPDSDYQ
jgi:hypothetical protein